MPLGVPFPYRATHLIEIRMPDGEDWEFGLQNRTIEDAAFRFEFADDSEGSRVSFKFRLDSRAEAVSPDGVAEYLARLRELNESLSYTLHRDSRTRTAGGGGVQWAVLSAATIWGLLVVAGAIFFAIWARRRWPAASRVDSDLAYSGIRGWLILVAIEICVGPLARLNDLTVGHMAYSAGSWASLTGPGSADYHRLWAPVLLSSALGEVLFLGLGVLLIVMFFRRRRIFPRVYVCALAGTAVFLGVVLLMISQLPVDESTTRQAVRVLGRSVVQAVIWIPYFLVSKRVKATFVW